MKQKFNLESRREGQFASALRDHLNYQYGRSFWNQLDAQLFDQFWNKLTLYFSGDPRIQLRNQFKTHD